MKKIKIGLIGAFISLLLLSHNAKAVPVEVAFVVDQSGSMSAEFAFIPGAITALDAALSALPAVTSTQYGVMGYMERSGNESLGLHANNDNLVYVDLTPTVANITSAVSPTPTLYCCGEWGYHAAYQATLGFSWSAATDAVKIIVLLTDEPGSQGGNAGEIPDDPTLSSELDLAAVLGDDFLLNVITNTGFYSQWDEAVFTTSSGFSGLFDITQLRTNAAQFTSDFVSAKISEVGDVICDPSQQDCSTVPEPGTLALFGLGIAGLAFTRRKKLAK